MNFDMNPWSQLPREAPYVLGIDEESIDGYNKSVSDKLRKVITGSIPEPFIGSIRSARLVLLNGNPGHEPEDLHWHSREDFRKAMLDNLYQTESQDYPFYPLNPAFALSGAGKWWIDHTRDLKDESVLDDVTFAKRLLVIEWFPYHSEKSPSISKRLLDPKGILCKSQYYSLQLALGMIEKGALVVGMRSKRLWTALDERLSRIHFLKNPQRVWLTRGNTEPGVFDQMVEALKRED